MRDKRPLPEAASRDENAVEMLSVWIADKGLHCSMKVGMYEDEGRFDEEVAWGIMLSDVARHLSEALSAGYSKDQAESLRKIRDSIIEELGDPSSEVAGKFV